MNFQILILLLITFIKLYGINLLELQKLEKLQSNTNKESFNFANISKFDNKSIPIENNISEYDEVLKNLKEINQTENLDTKKDKISIFQYESNQKILKKSRLNQVLIDEKKELQRFGDSFFNNGNLINSNLMPVPNNYKISIGDSISIWIYGKKNINSIFQVDKNGFIHIKNIGSIYVYNYDLIN